VGTAILSYKGTLYFGITGDCATIPDVGVLAAATLVDIEELRDRALERLGHQRPKRARAKEAD
jgi:hypothetical protein